MAKKKTNTSLFGQLGSGVGQANKSIYGNSPAITGHGVQSAPKPKPKDPNKPDNPKPKVPKTAPPGSYDPALDAQQRAARTGLEDLQADTGLAGQRGQEDRATAVGLASRNSERQQADFQTSLDNLFHNFQVQGRQQFQSANAAGVLHGGTQEAAAQVRGGNLERAEAPIHTGQQRETQDLASRLLDINRTADRADADRFTKVQRGMREQGYYNSDIEAEKWWQATQNNPDLLAQLGASGGKADTSGGKAGKKKKGPAWDASGLSGKGVTTTPKTTTPPSGQTGSTTKTTTPKATKPKKKGK